jgi:hypothetical protein
MTKEELKQEAEEYAEERCKDCYMCSADGKRNKCHFYTKRVEGYLTSAETREKRIAELKKENAELKEEIEKIGKSAGFLYNRELEQQIKEAKEIIKNLLIIHNDTFGDTDLKWRCNIIAEAENFYKEG